MANWNNVVSDQHNVFSLGDMFWNTKALSKYLPLLNGNITLVLGNHDHMHRQYAKLGLKVRPMREAGRTLLTHIPVHPDNLDRWKWNIHGHLHHGNIDDPRYICVSFEQVLMPMTIGELISEREKKV